MLKIFNDLELFFIDSYRRINIREYARLKNISPPSASKLLKMFEKEGLLVREEDKRYINYFANKNSRQFVELSKIYWFLQLKKTGLLDHIEKELVIQVCVLFGSFSKAEIKKESDIDLAIFTPSKKAINLEKFERKLKRKIQLFVFKNREEISKELLNNILNGFILLGGW